MDTRTIPCIICPQDCVITVEMDDREIRSVTGNKCKRGDVYSRQEVTAPMRIVTSSVAVEGGELPLVSVKTARDVPKEKIFDVIEALKNIVMTAPVHIGDVVLLDVAGTGADMVATKKIKQIKARREER